MYLQELVLLTTDVDRQRAFYAKTLGLPLIADSTDGFTLIVGHSRLRFEHTKHSASARTGAYHFAFNIPENLLAVGADWLSTRQPLIKTENQQTIFDFQNWQAHSVYAFDPDKNVIELIARHRLLNGSDHPFSAASLLNISEIGWPSANVSAQVEQFKQRLGVPVFDGAGSETFSALGDDHGLLIVVKRGRMWYPDTGLIADDWPIQIQVESEGHISTLELT